MLRISRNSPTGYFATSHLPDRAVEREQEDRHQHEADAGKRGRTAG